MRPPLPSEWYVTPQKLVPARDRWGVQIPGQYERTDLAPGLFAPGPSTEDQRLSDAVSHRGEIFWHHRVSVESTDRIEIPDQGVWSVVGHPKHWPMGTHVVVERAS